MEDKKVPKGGAVGFSLDMIHKLNPNNEPTYVEMLKNANYVTEQSNKAIAALQKCRESHKLPDFSKGTNALSDHMNNMIKCAFGETGKQEFETIVRNIQRPAENYNIGDYMNNYQIPNYDYDELSKPHEEKVEREKHIIELLEKMVDLQIEQLKILNKLSDHKNKDI